MTVARADGSGSGYGKEMNVLAKRTTACAMLAAGTALLVGCAAIGTSEWRGERHALSAVAEQAIKAEFPNARIEKVKCESEKGTGDLNVELEQGKQE